MCAWLEVSKSGYYEWRSRLESATMKRRRELKLLIQKAFDDSDGTYGYRRIWWQLGRWGGRARPGLGRALGGELGPGGLQPRARGGRPPPGRGRPGPTRARGPGPARRRPRGPNRRRALTS